MVIIIIIQWHSWHSYGSKWGGFSLLYSLLIIITIAWSIDWSDDDMKSLTYFVWNDCQLEGCPSSTKWGRTHITLFYKESQEMVEL